ncbi:MAG: glycosyltransferase [Candidatus Micrarchaeia archaeon]
MKLVITQANLTLKGGAERVVMKIAQHYKAKIYTAEYDPGKTFEEFRNLDIETIGKGTVQKLIPYGRASQGIAYGSAFYFLKLNDDYDVLNAHIAPSHWARKNNERVLWYCHTPLRDIYDLYDYRISLKKGLGKLIYKVGAKAVRSIDQSIVKDIECIVANSSNTKSRIEKYYGRKDAMVLNGGIDYKEYRNNGDANYFLYVSRISPNKRQEYAMKAFEIFKRKKKGYNLVIAGALSRDRLYQKYYEKIANEAKRIGNVEFVLDASEQKIIELYSNSTAVLFTAMNEDYGLVPLEAMASSKPVISVNEGGPKETIIQGKTGYLANSPEEMAKYMLEIASDKEFAEELGKNGRNRVIKNYSWERFFAEYDKILKKVSKGC